LSAAVVAVAAADLLNMVAAAALEVLYVEQQLFLQILLT
jgi:hypothetical protein